MTKSNKKINNKNRFGFKINGTYFIRIFNFKKNILIVFFKFFNFLSEIIIFVLINK